MNLLSVDRHILVSDNAKPYHVATAFEHHDGNGAVDDDGLSNATSENKNKSPPCGLRHLARLGPSLAERLCQTFLDGTPGSQPITERNFLDPKRLGPGSNC